MKTVSVREMKAQWAEIESQLSKGETFEVVNRGRPTARIIPAKPRQVVKWDNHLETAVRIKGKTGVEALEAGRGER